MPANAHILFGILDGWVGWISTSPRLQAVSDASYGMAFPAMGLLACFGVSAISTLAIIRRSKLLRSNDIDFGGPQKFHTLPTPRIGGASIAIGFSAIYIAIWPIDDVAIGRVMLVCSLPVFFTGLVHDLTLAIAPSRRMFASIVSAGLAFWLLGAGISEFSVPPLDFLTGFMMSSFALTVFASTGVVHAFNIIDGFNGLASMSAVLILLILAYVSSQVGDTAILHLTFALVGATLGFTIFNFPDAKIFLGDGGAYFLGFMTATTAVLLKARNPAVSPIFALLAMIYPIFETLFSMYRRRILQAVPLSRPDGMHLHSLVYRRLCRRRGSTLRASPRGNAITSVWMLCLCFVPLLPAAIWWDNTPVLLGFISAFVVLYCTLYWRIVRFRTPRWMVKVTQFSHGVFFK